jgi:cell wall-associated NlpC family hydrolase
MVRKFIPGLFIVVIMASCSSLKPLNFTSNKQVAGSATVSTQTATNNNKQQVKFLDDISVETGATVTKKTGTTEKTVINEPAPDANAYLNRSSSLEKATDLQLKYAILLNTEVEQLQDNPLLEHIDEWYGTRYRYGGSTKKGIDCSAFTQAIYMAAFAVSLPRTARDQYRNSRIISATEMKTGDLVFFNTTGGISHVGIYLQNNKFVHASSAYGVTISDMFDPYYLRRFIGVGRIEKPAAKLNQ